MKYTDEFNSEIYTLAQKNLFLGDLGPSESKTLAELYVECFEEKEAQEVVISCFEDVVNYPPSIGDEDSAFDYMKASLLSHVEKFYEDEINERIQLTREAIVDTLKECHE